jgi:non-specific serine/threonine protein kinase
MLTSCGTQRGLTDMAVDNGTIRQQLPPQRALPNYLTSFVGRESELATVTRLLLDNRLLTLVGAGGVGKTRLAVRMADTWRLHNEQVAGFVSFVDLASLLDPDLLTETLATQLGLHEQPGRAVVATVVDAIRSARGLLILDNCEHLIGACARVANELLIACPKLHIMSTSRQPLGIAGEVVWRVPSLRLPEAALELQQVASSEAVRLFAERARALSPTFELDGRNIRAVADICRGLDGIPLALELASARVTLLSPEQIAARLDDSLGLLVAGRRLAPVRQETMRATLDWSYALLTEPERALFERLSVFAGDFTIEAVEAIAPTAEPPGDNTLALLGRLVDSGMVAAEPAGSVSMRYRLLETLKQYGIERLRERAGLDAVRREHAAYYLRLAEEIEPDLSSPRVQSAQIRLAAEHDNFRPALGWLLERADVDRAQRLAGALGRFWFFRGHLSEAEIWLTRALTMPHGNPPTPGRAKCVQGLTMLEIGRGDYPAVERAAVESRALWHALGNQVQEAFSLFHAGLATTRQGKYSEARSFLEAGLAVSRAANDGAAECNCLFTLADLELDLGNIDAARPWAEAALAQAMAIGRVRQTAAARGFLGVISMRQKDYDTAAALLEASLSTWRELGELYWIAEALVRLGQLDIELQDLVAARAHLTEGLQLAWQQTDRHRIATALEGFIQIAVLEGEARLALQLAAAAESLRTAIGVPLPPADRTHLSRYLAKARESLGNPSAERAWVQGRRLGIDNAITAALADAERHSLPRDSRRGRNLLTAREQMVATLVAQGRTNRQIADELIIAEGTAERHAGNILAKLEVDSRSQIAAWAVAQGLAAPEMPTRM